METLEAATSTVPTEIVLCLLGGAIAFFILTIMIKAVKGWWIRERILKKTLDQQQEHWKGHVRPAFIQLLTRLYYQVKVLTRQIYPSYNERILTRQIYYNGSKFLDS